MSPEDALKREESRRELEALFFHIKQHHDALDGLYGKLSMRAHLQPYTEYRNEQLEELVKEFYSLLSNMPPAFNDRVVLLMSSETEDWLRKRREVLEQVQKFYEEHGGEL